MQGLGFHTDCPEEREKHEATVLGAWNLSLELKIYHVYLRAPERTSSRMRHPYFEKTMAGITGPRISVGIQGLGLGVLC